VALVLALLGAFSAANTAPVPESSEEAGEVGVDVAAGPALAGAVAIRVPPIPEPPPLDVVEGELKRGDSLARALGRQGVPPAIVHEVATAMRPHFDFRHARPGHLYRLERAADGGLVRFAYWTSPENAYQLERTPEGYHVQQHESELVPRPAMLAGLISTTLYSAVTALGESGQLARDFADVFAWDIDFQRSVKPGDGFQIVYERLHRQRPDGSEVYVRPGRILGARYDGAAGRHTAIYFEAEEGRGGYYRPDGSSVEGDFLMAPLRHARITSRFSQARRHPILKVTRPHHGIDYAAPSGAPVWSVADGEVIYRGRAGGFGNLVKVRHKNGYISYYSHLSRFARDLRVGQRVRQKQVIGYVGQTGLATGPHVCFRVQKDGRYVDPLKLRMGTRESIPDHLQPNFGMVRDLVLAELDGRRVVSAAP
jgi:murein DD-endopeptidase MepM/ murein hydrolase activator NlpD